MSFYDDIVKNISIEDIAIELSGSNKNINNMAKNSANMTLKEKLFPNDLTEELNKTIANSISSSDNFADNQARLGAAQALQAIGGLSKKDAKNIAKSVSADNIDESINNLKDKISESISEDKNIDKVMAAMKKKANTAIGSVNSEDVLNNMGALEKYARYPKAYFSNPDKEITNTRKKSAMAAYAGIAIGGRVLSGGTLTRDSYGRKDIAGIPLL